MKVSIMMFTLYIISVIGSIVAQFTIPHPLASIIVLGMGIMCLGFSKILEILEKIEKRIN